MWTVSSRQSWATLCFPLSSCAISSRGCFNFKRGLPGADIGWIILFNAGAFLLVDLMTNEDSSPQDDLIGEEPGDVILTDDLLKPIQAVRRLKRRLRRVNVTGSC